MCVYIRIEFHGPIITSVFVATAVTVVVNRHSRYLRYCTYAVDEIAITTAASLSVTKITQNHKVYDVACQTTSCLENLKCAS